MILYDIFLILSLPALAASILAVVLMRRALSAGRRLSSSAGLTASALCARMLNAAGISDVRVRKSEIAPKDRFRPSRGIVTLSPEHYNATDLPALAAWFRWLAIAAPEDWRPVQLPRRKRPPPRLVRALSDAEVGLLLAAPDLTTFVGMRDHFAMATLYQCGLRASELASLQIGSVLPDGYLLVTGKGGHERLVPYGERWHGLFEAYMRVRQTVRPGKRSVLLVNRYGRGLRDGRSVWVIVNRHARRALGLQCGFHRLVKSYSTRPWTGHYPHLLRASFATELMRRGVNLMAIAQMLGHADVATTQYYLGVDIEHLRQAVALHPRAKRVAVE